MAKNGVITGNSTTYDYVLGDTKSSYFMNKYLNLKPTNNNKYYENNLFTSNISLNKAMYCKEIINSDTEHTVNIQKLVTSKIITDITDTYPICFINSDGTRIAYVDNTTNSLYICDTNTMEVLYSTSYMYDYRQITYLNDNIYYLYKDTTYYVYKQLNMNTLDLSTIITTNISISTSINTYNYGTNIINIKNRYIIGNPYYYNSSTTYRILYLYDTETGYSGIISSYNNTGNTSYIYCCTDESSTNNNLYVFHSYRNTSGNRYSYGYKYDLVEHTKTQLYSRNFGASSWGPTPSVGSIGYLSGNYLYYGRYKADLSNGDVTTISNSKLVHVYYTGISQLPYYTKEQLTDTIIDGVTLHNYCVKLGDKLTLNNGIDFVTSTIHYLPQNIYNQKECIMMINDDIYYNGNTMLLPTRYALSDISDFDIVIFNTKNKLPTDNEDGTSYALLLKNYN